MVETVATFYCVVVDAGGKEKWRPLTLMIVAIQVVWRERPGAREKLYAPVGILAWVRVWGRNRLAGRVRWCNTGEKISMSTTRPRQVLGFDAVLGFRKRSD